MTDEGVKMPDNLHKTLAELRQAMDRAKRMGSRHPEGFSFDFPSVVNLTGKGVENWMVFINLKDFDMDRDGEEKLSTARNTSIFLSSLPTGPLDTDGSYDQTSIEIVIGPQKIEKYREVDFKGPPLQRDETPDELMPGLRTVYLYELNDPGNDKNPEDMDKIVANRIADVFNQVIRGLDYLNRPTKPYSKFS